MPARATTLRRAGALREGGKLERKGFGDDKFRNQTKSAAKVEKNARRAPTPRRRRACEYRVYVPTRAPKLDAHRLRHRTSNGKRVAISSATRNRYRQVARQAASRAI